MNVLLLCGGFGTRLERDLRSAIPEVEAKDTPSQYSNLPPLSSLLGLPKGLLPVNKKPLLDYWIEIFCKYYSSLNSEEVEARNVYLVCNGLHEQLFRSWANRIDIEYGGRIKIQILCNGVTENAKRNGSVADLHLAIETFKLAADLQNLLVVAGDTLLTRFDFGDFMAKCDRATAANDQCAAILVHYPITDAETLKSGVLELEPDQEGGVVDWKRCVGFLEKPGPDGTQSRIGCPCFYLLRPTALQSIPLFLQEKRGEGLDAIDASGKWVQWIVKRQSDNDRESVYSLPINGRLDIGGLASYIEADKFMTSS